MRQIQKKYIRNTSVVGDITLRTKEAKTILQIVDGDNHPPGGDTKEPINSPELAAEKMK